MEQLRRHATPAAAFPIFPATARLHPVRDSESSEVFPQRKSSSLRRESTTQPPLPTALSAPPLTALVMPASRFAPWQSRAPSPSDPAPARSPAAFPQPVPTY